jgi:hypothetical protein
VPVDPTQPALLDVINEVDLDLAAQWVAETDQAQTEAAAHGRAALS